MQRASNMDQNMTIDTNTRRLTRGDRAVIRAVQSWNQGARALFVNAMHRGEPSRLEAILRENAVRQDGSYICHARDRYLPGRSNVNAVKIADGRRSPSAFPLFSGPFSEGDVGSKDRLSFGRYQIFTFEYDVADDAAFFEEQVGWAQPVKEYRKSRYGRLHALLSSKYYDFHLLSVVWSGNKSFHIHVVFDTAMYLDRGVAPDAASLHAGHHAHWEVLAVDVEAVLAPSRAVKPDGNLAWQTAFRRTPDGVRKVDKPDHPLGLKKGMKVHQLVVWERESQRKKADVKALFLSPTRYPARSTPEPSAGQADASDTAYRRYPMSAEQTAHVESHLTAHFSGNDCPVAFSHLAFERGSYRAKFHNGSMDMNPSSFMAEDYCTPRLVGANADVIDHSAIPPLPLPLGQMISVWCSELDQTSDFDAGALEKAYTRLDRDLPPRLLLGTPAVLIHAPEGIRKSSSIMRLIHLSTVRGERGRPSMFACSSYENARAKAREFNFPDRSNPDARRCDGYVGVYWPSATELYRELAADLGLPCFTPEDADEAGVKNVWALIECEQPEIMAKMKLWHAEKMAEMAENNVVLFTAHEVAFRWRDHSRTRWLLAPDAFAVDFDRAAAHEATRLNWLIIDEIAYPMFVDLLTSNQMDWLRKLRDASPKVWSGRSSTRQRDQFAKHVAATGETAGLDIFDVQRAMQAGLDSFQPVRVRDTPHPEYPLRGEADEAYPSGKPKPRPYACDGETYFVRPRDWWLDGIHRVAQTLIMTTTEMVPATVVREVMKAGASKISRSYDDQPDDVEPGLVDYRPNFRLGRDPVDVYVSGDVRANTIDDQTAEYQNQPDVHIISNKLRDVGNATNHHSARGVNDLTDKDIVQIVTMFPPAQYKELRALGSWLGRDDLVRIAHIDQINQSCGRNRGPRNQGKGHLLKINMKLFRLLNACPSAMRELRYAFRTTLDKNQIGNLTKVSSRGR
jgi:hypothetical protein